MEKLKSHIDTFKSNINMLERSTRSFENVREKVSDLRNEAKSLGKIKWISIAAGTATSLGTLFATSVAPPSLFHYS